MKGKSVEPLQSESMACLGQMPFADCAGSIWESFDSPRMAATLTLRHPGRDTPCIDVGTSFQISGN